MPNMERPTGSARLEFVAGVHLLHPEDAVFEAMLQGGRGSNRPGSCSRRPSAEGMRWSASSSSSPTLIPGHGRRRWSMNGRPISVLEHIPCQQCGIISRLCGCSPST